MLPFFNKKSSFLFFSLIVSLFLTSSLTAKTQQEEGWRWRSSFNISVGEKTINLKDLHNRLSQWEKAIFDDNPYRKNHIKPNVVVGAITLIFKYNGEYKSFVHYLSEINGNNALSFISGNGENTKKKYTEDYSILHNGNLMDDYLNQEFKYINSRILQITEELFEENMGNIIKQAITHKKKDDLSFPTLLSRIEEFSKIKFNSKNAQNVYHSEQWLLQWLEEEKNGSNLPELIEKIIKEESNRQDGTLTGVLEGDFLKKGCVLENIILHIHSSRDPCSFCALSLGFIASIEDLKFKKALRKLLAKLNRNETDKLNFNLLVSSRLPLGHENNNGYRRRNAGHDKEINESSILLNEVSPFYLQMVTEGESPKMSADYTPLESIGSFRERKIQANQQIQKVKKEQQSSSSSQMDEESDFPLQQTQSSQFSISSSQMDEELDSPLEETQSSQFSISSSQMDEELDFPLEETQSSHPSTQIIHSREKIKKSGKRLFSEQYKNEKSSSESPQERQFSQKPSRRKYSSNSEKIEAAEKLRFILQKEKVPTGIEHLSKQKRIKAHKQQKSEQSTDTSDNEEEIKKKVKM